jgi:hypothetical protein
MRPNCPELKFVAGSPQLKRLTTLNESPRQLDAKRGHRISYEIRGIRKAEDSRRAARAQWFGDSRGYLRPLMMFG